MAKESYLLGSSAGPSSSGKSTVDRPNNDKGSDKDRSKVKTGKKSSEKQQGSTGVPLSRRLVSLDAYRGLIMLLMASGGASLATIEKLPPDSTWAVVLRQFTHAEWQGCAIWDLIQPAFMFMVGVSLPYSYANRRSRGDSYLKAFLHALVRAVVLVLLGVFLASQPPAKMTNWLFTNVLAQIGLGYLFVFLLVDRWKWLQVSAIVVILAGYGFAFYAHPLPGPEYDYASVGADSKDLLPGVAGHWSQHLNFAADLDRKFLNLFPRPQPFVATNGGYQTWNFIPSIATMIMGLMAGELLRSGITPRKKFFWMLGAGAVCVVTGLAMGYTFCPIVKRIWTPSWTLLSGGYVLWILALFYDLTDLRGWQRWTFPLVVVGTNSIAMYLMSQLTKGWVAENLRITFGQTIFGGDYGLLIQRLSVLTVFWLVCLWLYRQKAFLKI